jgi:hypothetical protein
MRGQQMFFGVAVQITAEKHANLAINKLEHHRMAILGGADIAKPAQQALARDLVGLGAEDFDGHVLVGAETRQVAPQCARSEHGFHAARVEGLLEHRG